MIDDVDRELIRNLRIDGRMAYSTLATKVGLSDAATRQRIRRLTEAGAIDIVAITNPAKLGLNFQTMLTLEVSGDVRQVAEGVGALPEAVYVVVTAGRFDLLAEIVCADADAFLEVLATVRALDGVASVESSPYLKTITQSYDWVTA